MNDEVTSDEGLAAILGMLVLANGGEFRLTRQQLVEGLPPDSAIRVRIDAKNEDVVIDVARIDS